MIVLQFSITFMVRYWSKFIQSIAFYTNIEKNLSGGDSKKYWAEREQSLGNTALKCHRAVEIWHSGCVFFLIYFPTNILEENVRIIMLKHNKRNKYNFYIYFYTNQIMCLQ